MTKYNIKFYDIESLENVFTNAIWTPKTNTLDIFYLIDDDNLQMDDAYKQEVSKRIFEHNKNIQNTKINYYDLQKEDNNNLMANIFGVSVEELVNRHEGEMINKKINKVICDTDPEYNPEIHPFLAGYNSHNYDLTMLSHYFNEVYFRDNETQEFHKTSAHLMRKFNNNLFDLFRSNMPKALMIDPIHYSCTEDINDAPTDWADQRNRIRNNFIKSGRHFDVTILNEGQKYGALKKLLGTLGYQILEYELQLEKINSKDDLKNLIAYNVSDVVNLEKLFDHNIYTSNFENKLMLMENYPEIIYQKDDKEYKPVIGIKTVRQDRMTLNTTASQIATKVLCPYGHLDDYEYVSFDYPSEKQAKALGIKRQNVLEQVYDFIKDNYKDHKHVIDEFEKVYSYYKSIEGKNFNGSKNYYLKYSYQYDKNLSDSENSKLAYEYSKNHCAYDIYKIPTVENTTFYYKKDGTPTSSTISFSFGGIHGIEVNVSKYEKDFEKYLEKKKKIDEFKKVYPDPIDVLSLKKKEVITEDGEIIKFNDVKKSKYTLKKIEKLPEEKRLNDVYKTIKKPELFVKAGENTKRTKVSDKYLYSSNYIVNHEDFKSYYPNLLRRMDAFYNEQLGYDRYGEIYLEKEKYGKLKSDPNIAKEQRSIYAIKQKNVKLILNSATGAADAKFDSPIKMPNKIISMRIIGQLFTYLVGIYQTLQGANPVSTNTDGLYTVFEEKLNNKTLDEIQKDINVDIEPELLGLIAKDSNNRLEFSIDPNKPAKITSTAGADLSCYEDVTPRTSITHPAIIDYVLGEYLMCAMDNYSGKDNEYENVSFRTNANRDLITNILKSAIETFPKEKTLRMCQRITASSYSSIRYVFKEDPITKKQEPMQHYNRVFIMKDNTPNTYFIKCAAARVVTDAMLKKRKEDAERNNQRDDCEIDENAERMLRLNNVTNIPTDREPAIMKVTNIEDTWFMRIENRDLFYLTEEEKDDIINNLDIEKYVDMVEYAFNTKWKNDLDEDFTVNEVKHKEYFHPEYYNLI